MKVLVLGGTGMLGHKVYQVLKERFAGTYCAIRQSKQDEPVARVSLLQSDTVIGDVNVEDLYLLASLLDESRPEVIVNCAGIIKQRAEAKASLPSIKVNSLLPPWLAEQCASWGGRLIHISTDCVFNGKGRRVSGGYTENDFSDAEDLYGKSKHLGEVIAENAITLRTSIIGRELFNRSSLLEWFLSQQKNQVAGFSNALYSGVTTNHLAEVIGDVIQFHPQLSGLYQVTSQTISKYELLCLLRDAYKLDVEIVPDENFHCDRSMLGDKFRRATGYVCPPWPNLTAQLANDPTPYEHWRNER